ncbi:MAG: response regulator [Rhodobacteraceae bacterium]|nr:response regulator [Paracoccaceae bacterium]
MPSKSKILLVDDEVALLDMTSQLLETEGHQTIKAESVAALHKAFDGPQPDLVLLDLKLGSESGLDQLPAIKKRWPETEVIILTGHATIEAAVEATKKGAYSVQTKPVQTAELILKVSQALEHKRMSEENSKLRKVLRDGGGSAPIFKCPDMKEVCARSKRSPRAKSRCSSPARAAPARRLLPI